jgi:hypothetical protein
MKTFIITIFAASLAFGAQMANLKTGKVETTPQKIANIDNPELATLLQNGYRLTNALPDIAAGYERNEPRWIDGDGTNAAPVYADTLIADRVAREAAQAATNEVQRQLDKSLQLKIYENQYLGICQQLGGVGKLGFDELQARITALMAQDKDTAVMLTLQLLTLDAAGKREGGLKWWDDIAYHAEIVK